MKQQHFKVKQNGATLGFALYNKQGVFFTPNNRVSAKQSAEVWGALEGNRELPNGVKLESWTPHPPLPRVLDNP